jgi:hypothetical protein
MVRRNGWTFIRDSQITEAVARDQKAICNRCGRTAQFRHANFDEISQGEDVTTLIDGSDWGIMVSFPCKCRVSNGYAFIGDVDRMDID